MLSISDNRKRCHVNLTRPVMMGRLRKELVSFYRRRPTDSGGMCGIANFANNKLSGLPLKIGNLTQFETLDLRSNPNLSQHDLELIRAKIPKTTILTD